MNEKFIKYNIIRLMIELGYDKTASLKFDLKIAYYKFNCLLIKNKINFL